MEKDIIGKKPGWMYRQSGVIPFLIDEGKLKVVLITSTSTGSWVFPKGVVEKNMTEIDSALKEGKEEAGISGIAFPKEVGEYEYEKWSGKCIVKMFAMNVKEISEDWLEMDDRKRAIVEIEKAKEMIENPKLIDLLEKGKKEFDINVK